MVDLDWSARELGLRLGLGDLNARPSCHGYSHACPCVECRGRGRNVSDTFRSWLASEADVEPPRLWRRRKNPSQPWESDRAA